MKDAQRRKRFGISTGDACAIDVLHNFGIDLQNRQLWISGTNIDLLTADDAGPEPGVEYMMSNRVIRNLHLLRLRSETAPALVHLHTCGGDYHEGMAIYNALRSMPFPITIISYTHARSMSSIIIQAAEKRVLMPDSYFMIHYGQLYAGGEAKTVKSNVEFDKIGTDRMLDIYVEKAKKGKKFIKWSETRIRNFLKRKMDEKGDFFLMPEEAVEFGFADEVFDFDWQRLTEFS
ncbi:MAG: ATP-dependent Clp protease proteolytic subunit [Patescibacteria group bacterium]